MRNRTLGDTTVGCLGTGDVSLARAAARGIDAGAVELALHDAIEAGVDVVDVADDAERLAGDAVRAQRARDRIVVACRVPALASPRDALHERLPAGHLQAQVESSLRASRLDALPLALLPLRAEWRGSTAWAELASTCARLVREGKVLRWGASLGGDAAKLEERAEPPLRAIVSITDDVAPPPAKPAVAGQRLLDEPWLACIAVRFHLCDRTADALIAAALERKLAVLAREPLAGGALGGALGPGVKLGLRDDRRDLDLERIAIGVAKLSLLVKREPPAARASAAARQIVETGTRPRELECATVAELALRYVIDRGVIALPRLHRREDLGEAVAAASAPPLSPDLMLRTEHIFSTLDS